MAIDCAPQGEWKAAQYDYSHRFDVPEPYIYGKNSREFTIADPENTPFQHGFVVVYFNSGFDYEDINPAVSNSQDDGFAIVTNRLIELSYLEEDEDYTRPTEFSFKLALKILNESKTAINSAFPRASFSTSEEGAIHAYWRKASFLIQLILPYEDGGNGYIQVLRNDVTNVYHDLTGKKLAEILDEFNGQK